MPVDVTKEAYVNEVMAACEGMEELKRFIKAMDGPELTVEDEKEIEYWSNL